MSWWETRVRVFWLEGDSDWVGGVALRVRYFVLKGVCETFLFSCTSAAS